MYFVYCFYSLTLVRTSQFFASWGPTDILRILHKSLVSSFHVGFLERSPGEREKEGGGQPVSWNTVASGQVQRGPWEKQALERVPEKHRQKLERTVIGDGRPLPTCCLPPALRFCQTLNFRFPAPSSLESHLPTCSITQPVSVLITDLPKV